MKISFIIIFALIVGCYANAQITTSIYPRGGAFKEFPMLNKIHSENIPLYEVPKFNLDSVIKDEMVNREIGGFSARSGYAINIDYSMEHGKWIILEDKKIWSIRFHSNKAYTLDFIFTDLKLSGGAKLYVYNSNGTVVDGPYTYKNNATEEFRSIGSGLIAGEEAIIQIIEPKVTEQSSFISITKVVHGFMDNYREILPSKNKKGDSFQAAELDCHNDVMCYPEYENLSRGVAKLYMNGYLCSGALLNNVRGNNRPYLLSAYHCIDRNSDDALKTWGTLITEGRLLINSVYTVEAGASFIVK